MGSRTSTLTLFLAPVSTLTVAVRCGAQYLFCCVIFKYDALTSSDDLQAKMSQEQKHGYIVPNMLLSFVLFCSVLGALAPLFSHDGLGGGRRPFSRRAARRSK